MCAYRAVDGSAPLQLHIEAVGLTSRRASPLARYTVLSTRRVRVGFRQVGMPRVLYKTKAQTVSIFPQNIEKTTDLHSTRLIYSVP
jgi:hypothetical protein